MKWIGKVPHYLIEIMSWNYNWDLMVLTLYGKIIYNMIKDFEIEEF